MARIRRIQISNFRGIEHLDWFPSPGINCLIGPGDSGKSTILDAIDLCLGARRAVSFSDADFHLLDVEQATTVRITLGELGDELKSLEGYGPYLRSFDKDTGKIDDEPESEGETVLTLQISVGDDLEPEWTLVSERAEAQGLKRNLSWSDRITIAPTRIGSSGDTHLGWRRGSILNKLSEEKADASAALAKAARDARIAFSKDAKGQLGEALAVVAQKAHELGVPVGEEVQAMLDMHSATFGGGTVSLHDAVGVPLWSLGTGSRRLLIAGLQRAAAEQTSIVLVDELEHGLEPHRIIKLLGSLGAKEAEPLQAFITTHSPVVLRELSGDQLHILRRQADGRHVVAAVGTEDDVQGTIRSFPEAFLSHSVLVCEGATEVGLVRGIDLHRTGEGDTSLAALGVALVDCGGGDENRSTLRAATFQKLGYRVAVLRDNDKPPTTEIDHAFRSGGGTVFTWDTGQALEDALFAGISDDAVGGLLGNAIENCGSEKVDEQIKSACEGRSDLKDMEIAIVVAGYDAEKRDVLARAAKAKRNGWFKSVTAMEEAARTVVAPDLPGLNSAFSRQVEAIFEWISDVTSRG